MITRNYSLMAVFAHPDDESFGPSSTLAMYASRGVKTYLVCATRGEKGKVGGEEAVMSPEEVGKLREEELRCAAETMGLESFRLLGYPDGGLEEVDFNELTGRIVAVIREFMPDVLITFGPEGITGHPDHKTVGRAAKEAFHAAGDPARFAETISEGLEPHAPAKLYFYVLPRSMVEALKLDFQGVDDSLVTTVIDVSGFEEKRAKAIRCHTTQLPAAHEKRDEEEGILREKYRKVNYFRLAATRVPLSDAIERDLFEGLD